MKTKIMSTISVLFMMVLAMTAFSGLALAEEVFDLDDQNEGPTLPLGVVWVKINGDMIEDHATISEDIKRGQTIDVSVKLEAFGNIEDLTVEAAIYGDEHKAIRDNSETFDVDNETRYTVDLELELPENMEQDHYDLRIFIADRNSALAPYNYNLKIDTQRHAVIIKEVRLDPRHEVKAGQALNANVRVKNVGEKEEDVVSVIIEIPELNMYRADDIYELEQEDSATSEDLYMRVPKDAQSGIYEGTVTVEFDDGYDEITETFTINVIGTDVPTNKPGNGNGNVPAPEPKTVITVGPDAQDTPRGEGGAIYPITINNEAKEAKSYTIEVTGVESFGTAKISPSTLVVVEGQNSETVYVYVAASEDATLGQHTFAVNIKSGNKNLLSQPMTANVVEPEGKAGTWNTLKVALQIGLGVLVVILIILALVVAFRNMRSDEDEGLEEDASTGQTYY